jgi:hypothetical protein
LNGTLLLLVYFDRRVVNNLTLLQVEKKVWQAIRSIRCFKRQASDRRETFLENLAAAKAEAEDTTTESIVKRIKQREQLQSDFRILKRVNKTQQGNCQITFVERPVGDGKYEECNSKETVKGAGTEETIQRMWQANHTPFLQPPILPKVGPLGISPAADEILAKGELTLSPTDPPLDEYTRRFIKELRRPSDLPELKLEDVQITPDRPIASWKKAHESTSGPDPVLHFGHLKAGIHHENIVRLHSILSNIPFMLGFSPNSWQRMVNVQLQKKPGVFLIEKLRMIVLLHALYNNNNKWIGRSLFRHAERYNAIAPEQYGCRNGRDSATQALNKKLTNDIFRLKKGVGCCVLK